MKPDCGTALDHAPWPVFVVDDSGTIRMANPAAVQHLGTSLEAGSMLSATIWAPDNTLTVEEFLGQLERAPSPSREVRLRVRGGNARSFTAYVSAFAGDGCRMFLFQLPPVAPQSPAAERAESPQPNASPAAPTGGSSEGDLTPEAARAQQHRLHCALQLTRTVAHDFNNALTGILGHASLILSRMEMTDPWRKSLIEIEKSAQKAAEIAQDLADFSSSAKDPKRSSSGNLNRVVRHALQPLRKIASDATEWIEQFEPAPFAVEFDEAKLQQAIVRILENAVEAIGGKGQITVRTLNHAFDQPVTSASVQLPAGRYVSLEVTDSGPGVPANVLPRVFEPFFTTKAAPHRGVGLAWVYGIVTNHGGVVALTSPPGQGTTVRIFLPAQDQIVKDQPTQLQTLRGDETVLVVDDEEMLLRLCETVLTAFGYRVIQASSGAQALDAVTQMAGEIQLVVTDLVMPGMSGRELIDRLGALAPGMPSLCMSGYSLGGDSPKDEHYLRKPFTTQELLRKVKSVLHPEIQQ